jgi:hypothetical protein
MTRHLLSQSAVKTEVMAKVQETFYRYPSGEQAKVDDSTFVQFADGSTVEILEQVSPAGAATQRRTVTDLNKRRNTVIDGLTESITTYKLSDKAVELRRGQTDPTCSAPRSAARARLLGFDVVRLEEQRALPDGEIWKVESWRAPSLNCLRLKETFYLGRQDSPLSVTNVRLVTEVRRERPAASLLTIPAAYVERSPSAVVAEYQRRYAQAQDVCPTCLRMEAPDRAYHNQQ